MDLSKREETYFGICKCCLEDGCFKNMWAEYYWDGKKEVYGEMLIDCFALTRQQPDGLAEHIEQICEKCIDRLRDALSFKKQVLISESRLLGNCQDDDTNITVTVDRVTELDVESDSNWLEEIKPTTKKRNNKKKVKFESEVEILGNKSDVNNEDDTKMDNDAKLNVVHVNHNQMENDNKIHKECEDDNKMQNDNEVDEEYEDIEYLEIENISGDEDQLTSVTKEQSKDSTEPKRKWPKKKKKHERLKTYRKYTESDLRNCLEAIRNNEMTKKEACKFYNVPKNTVNAKLRSKHNTCKFDTEDAVTKMLYLEKMFKLVDEIKIILTYTNATPYKTNLSKYYCAYCSTEGPQFEEAEELRVHTRTKHADERIKHIDHIMRPHSMNEVLKLDILDLHCTICCVAITKWSEMFEHLKEAHAIVFEEAYKRVIPYSLQSDIRCVLCQQAFSNYRKLDGHMNSHYNNYICFDCGDTFLALSRLKKHIITHSSASYQCELCEKSFTLEKYRKKHIDLVHNQERKIKCNYCTEKFIGEYQRHLHVMEKHKEKVKYITCELCGKVFDGIPYYSAHLRKKHKNEKVRKCKFCDKQFFLVSELRLHMLSHAGEKNYACTECDKRFANKWGLKQHSSVHSNIVGKIWIKTDIY